MPITKDLIDKFRRMVDDAHFAAKAKINYYVDLAKEQKSQFDSDKHNIFQDKDIKGYVTCLKFLEEQKLFDDSR